MSLWHPLRQHLYFPLAPSSPRPTPPRFALEDTTLALRSPLLPHPSLTPDAPHPTTLPTQIEFASLTSVTNS